MIERKLALLSDRFNTLWYENGIVKILDRRVYPHKQEYVTCESLEDIAVAIEEMIIQGAPPIAYAAGFGLVLEIEANANKPYDELKVIIRNGAKRLRNTRPTGWDLFYMMDRCIELTDELIHQDANVAQGLLEYVNKQIEDGNWIARETGREASELLESGDRILTICFAGAALIYMLYFAAESGKEIELFAPETRPYLQGARLTAQSAKDMGIQVTIVTDGMPGYLMSRGMVTKFVSTADKITWDGHIVNKVGTYQIALAAHDNDIPYYVLGYNGPAPDAQNIDSVVIEERDPDEVLYCMGVRTAVEGVRGYYPAFDITPPRLVSAIVTDRGIFPPNLVYRYFINPKKERGR